MQVDAAHDELRVRIGSTFRDPDVVRLEEAVTVLGPFSRLTIDFTAARQCDDAALVRLASVLACVPSGQIAVRGLALHAWRLLTHLAVDFDRSGASRQSAQEPLGEVELHLRS